MLVIYVAKNILANAAIWIGLIILATLSCGIVYVLGHHVLGIQTFEEIMGNSAWEAELKNNGVIPKDAQITVTDVRELAPGVFSLDVNIYKSNGWIVYKYMYYNKHTGAHVVVATHSRPAESEGYNALDDLLEKA